MQEASLSTGWPRKDSWKVALSEILRQRKKVHPWVEGMARRPAGQGPGERRGRGGEGGRLEAQPRGPGGYRKGPGVL